MQLIFIAAIIAGLTGCLKKTPLPEPDETGRSRPDNATTHSMERSVPVDSFFRQLDQADRIALDFNKIRKPGQPAPDKKDSLGLKAELQFITLYSIQVAVSTSKNLILEKQKQTATQTQEPVEVVFEPPFYKLRVGKSLDLEKINMLLDYYQDQGNTSAILYQKRILADEYAQMMKRNSLDATSGINSSGEENKRPPLSGF